jgi:molecular chaperone DnaK
MADRPGRYVGIDLGTTFSAVAYVNESGEPSSVPNESGKVITPSAVFVGPDRRILVGQPALDAGQDHPGNLARNFKRDMGEELYPSAVGGKQFSPHALSALVLKSLGGDAKKALGQIGGAVITVPAYFGDARRKATQDAGRMASLNVLDIINEPTAAALANGFRQYVQAGGATQDFRTVAVATTAPTTTLVFDLGGGTFDVTIIRIEGERFDVMATGGEVRLGGLDFDIRLVEYVAEEFTEKYNLDPRDQEHTHAALINYCEQAKIALSAGNKVAVTIDAGGKKMAVPITRALFEDLTADLLSRCQLSTELLLEDALLTWDRIDEILLVGGSSRMPMVSEMLAMISGKKPTMAIAPDEIVAHGAAIHAAILEMHAHGTGERAVVPLDVEQDDSWMVDPDMTPPRGMEALKPEVAAAMARLDINDVNAHSLGVIVRSTQEGGKIVNSTLIPRNTPLPATRSKIFGTHTANQRTVRIRVVEGETRDPYGCNQIGECVINQLPKGLPRGAPVEVTFKYDKSGRILVEAVERSNNTRAEAIIDRHVGFQPTADEEEFSNLLADIEDNS